MKNVSAYLLAAVLGLTVLGCKKDKETPAPSKTELLTGKDWIITAATIDPGLPNSNGGGAITDFYNSSLYPSCSKDDFERYDKPNAYKSDEGANRCQGATQNQTGTWTFNSTETIITTQIGNTAESYNVILLADNQMKLSQVVPIFGVNYTVTATYAKK